MRNEPTECGLLNVCVPVIAALQPTFWEVRFAPIVFSNGSRGGCSVPERLCDADGDAVLFVLDGTRWGELGTGWLGCNRSRPIRSTACYRIGAITHSLPREHSARELVSASSLVKR